MNNYKNVNGKNNKILFVMPDKSKVEDFSDIEIDLLNKFPLSIFGENNTVSISITKREDIEAFLKREGLIIGIVGNNNIINLGQINYAIDNILGLIGLQIFIGGEADPFSEPKLPRYASNCSIDIGDNTVFCGCRLYLQDDNSSLKIGKNCMFSWGIEVWCTDVHTITDLEGIPLNYGHSIEIGNHVWVGKDVKIGKNTKISNDSVVGWGSIVTKVFEDSNCVIVGNPAKVVKRDINWDYRDLQNYALYRKNSKNILD